MRTTTKIAKDHAQKALDMIITKYGFKDHHEIDCEKMSGEDYAIYVELHQSIIYLKQILGEEAAAN
jgi:hypothetical protein